MFNRNELSIYRKNVLSCPQEINYSLKKRLLIKENTTHPNGFHVRGELGW